MLRHALWGFSAVILALAACNSAPADEHAVLDIGDPCGFEAGGCAAGLICDLTTNTCQACGDSLEACNNQCVDPSSFESDERNCGACNHWCFGGTTCESGQCVCPPNTQTCPNTGCIDLQSDQNNCGACGNACGDGESCVAGQCEPNACAGLVYCDCGWWVPANQACPAVTCDPCDANFTYCGCGECLVDDLSCSPMPTHCPAPLCPATLTDCGDGVKADPGGACPSNEPVQTLLGTTSVQWLQDSSEDGWAEAFLNLAWTAGTIHTLHLYIDPASTATTVQVGVYADGPSYHPGALLTSGTITNPVAGWNTISVPPASIHQGTLYWIAVLSPEGHGTVVFRDGSGPTEAMPVRPLSESSASTALSSLPPHWSPGPTWTTTSMSAFATN